MRGAFFREGSLFPLTGRCGGRRETTGDAGDAGDAGGRGGRRRGIRETQETFLEESFPHPSKNLLTGYRGKDLSRGILPAAKLWRIFAEVSRVCKHPLFASGKNPPEFSPAGENSGGFLRKLREKAACRLLRSFLKKTPKFCRRQNAARQVLTPITRQQVL